MRSMLTFTQSTFFISAFAAFAKGDSEDWIPIGYMLIWIDLDFAIN